MPTETTTSDKPKPSTSTAPRIRLSRGRYSHCAAIFLSLIAFACVLVAYVSSASYSSDITAGHLSNTFWLVEISQTSGSKIDLKADAASKTFRQWGLGTFGWCEWNHNAVDMQQKGKCQKVAGWILPASAPEGDSILAIEMSTAIAKMLSPVSHLLLIAILAPFAYFIVLIWTFIRCPKTSKMPRDGPDTYILDPKHASHDSLYHFIRRPIGRALILVPLGIVVAAIITIGVGVVEINNWDSQNLEATFGMGGYLLIVAFICLLLIDPVVYFGGLRVVITKKESV